MAPKGVKVIASNRRARHDYLVLDTIECGLVLVGSEVKALRDAKVQLGDAYARVERGELWLHNMHIAAYEHASGFGAHAVDRPRKLLAHRNEIERLGAKVAQDHLTLVPLSLYFKEGRAKIELALAKGRKSHDRRQDLAARDAKRDMDRAMKGYDRGA
jgi:SsrA-binding protein